MPKDKGPEWNHVTIVDDVAGKGTAYVTMRGLYCDKALCTYTAIWDSQKATGCFVQWRQHNLVLYYTWGWDYRQWHWLWLIMWCDMANMFDCTWLFKCTLVIFFFWLCNHCSVNLPHKFQENVNLCLTFMPVLLLLIFFHSRFA